MREEVFAFVEDEYGVVPDYPWPKTPDHAVMRHPLNRKWFAVALLVRRDVLGLPGEGNIDVLNVKCEEVMLASFLTRPGIFPGYHMSKGKWLTILLDGTVPLDEICMMIRMSYNLTRPSMGRKTRRDDTGSRGI